MAHFSVTRNACLLWSKNSVKNHSMFWYIFTTIASLKTQKSGSDPQHVHHNYSALHIVFPGAITLAPLHLWAIPLTLINIMSIWTFLPILVEIRAHLKNSIFYLRIQATFSDSPRWAWFLGSISKTGWPILMREHVLETLIYM